MVVDYVCEIIGGEAVCLDKNLILQLLVFYGNSAVNSVLEGGCALKRHFLADDIGRALCHKLVDFLLGEITAVAVVACTGIIAVCAQTVEAFLGTEAAVSLALANKLLGIGDVHIPSFALYIGAVVAAYIRTFIVHKSGTLQGIVDNINCALDLSFLVGVLDAQDKLAAEGFCNQVFIKRCSQVAHMHEACRAGRKSCSYGFV